MACASTPVQLPKPLTQNTALDAKPAAPLRTAPRVLATVGRLSDERLNEVSGLAPSLNHPDRLWAINDSGNAAEVFLLNRNGQVDGRWSIEAPQQDWEALATTLINGMPFLLIADTGDNLRRRKEVRIYAVPEPTSLEPSSTPLSPSFQLRFRYPEASYDVEAMSISDNAIYLLTKQRPTSAAAPISQIFRLPLRAITDGKVITADQVGELALPSRTIDIFLLSRLLDFDPLQPTDWVISSNNRDAFVLNYVQVLHYVRESAESWGQALARKPSIITRHGLAQAEAITIDEAGVVWLTSERQNAPLLTLN